MSIHTELSDVIDKHLKELKLKRFPCRKSPSSFLQACLMAMKETEIVPPDDILNECLHLNPIPDSTIQTNQEAADPGHQWRQDIISQLDCKVNILSLSDGQPTSKIIGLGQHIITISEINGHYEPCLSSSHEHNGMDSNDYAAMLLPNPDAPNSSDSSINPISKSPHISSLIHSDHNCSSKAN